MSSLGCHNSSFKAWGLKKNPFSVTPPDDPDKLGQIFYGRDEEIETSLPALYEGRNIQVRGAMGIGKTTLTKSLLYQLQKEVAELEEQILVLYIPQIPGLATLKDFYKALVLAIARVLVEDGINPEAEDLMNAIGGYTAQKPKKSTQGKAEFWLLSFTRTVEDETSRTPTDKIDPYPLLLDLLEQAERTYTRVVVAVDDLDKANPATVYEILENSLELLRSSEPEPLL